MSPSREHPVQLTFPDGATIRFARNGAGWVGYGDRGQCMIAHRRLFEAMAILAPLHGLTDFSEPDEVRELHPRLVWHLDEDGEGYLTEEERP